MTPALTVAAGSTAVLAVLLVLYRSEDARGERIILVRVREFMDRVVVSVCSAITRFFSHIGTGAFQATLHFLIHRLLSLFIRLLAKFESYLFRLQRRNKKIAIVMREGDERTHLDEIASHKAETTLSDEERRKRRSH